MSNTNYKEFIKAYHKKIKNDKDREDSFISPMDDTREKIAFQLTYSSHTPAYSGLRTDYGKVLMTLDQEDIDYFYNKYKNRLEEEMRGKIDEIKNEYKDLIK